MGLPSMIFLQASGFHRYPQRNDAAYRGTACPVLAYAQLLLGGQLPSLIVPDMINAFGMLSCINTSCLFLRIWMLPESTAAVNFTHFGGSCCRFANQLYLRWPFSPLWAYGMIILASNCHQSGRLSHASLGLATFENVYNTQYNQVMPFLCWQVSRYCFCL